MAYKQVWAGGFEHDSSIPDGGDMEDVACCPECGSVHLDVPYMMANNEMADSSITYKARCTECKHEWLQESAFVYFNTVEALHEEQQRILKELYSDEGEDKEYAVHLNEQYDFITECLSYKLGNDAHVSQIDMDLYETYRNCYKSDHGRHDHSHVTFAQAKDYLANRNNTTTQGDW